MVKRIKHFLALTAIAGILSSCATTRVPPDALVKLPEKKVVSAKELTPLKPIDPQLAREKTLIEQSLTKGFPTPIWVPPLITKVLILPYVDSNGALHSGQYVFLKLKEGKWIVGNYLLHSTSKTFEPLKTKTAAKSFNRPYVVNERLHDKKQNPQEECDTCNWFGSSRKHKNEPSRRQIYFQNTIKAMQNRR